MTSLKVAVVTADEFSELMSVSGIDLPTSDLFVLTRGDLAGLIDLAETNGLIILGLDGARAEGSSIMPLIEYIADFSEIAGSLEFRVRQSAEAARQIDRLWGSEAELVEVVLDGLVE